MSFKLSSELPLLLLGYREPSIVFVLYIGEAVTLSTGPNLTLNPSIDFLPAV